MNDFEVAIFGPTPCNSPIRVKLPHHESYTPPRTPSPLLIPHFDSASATSDSDEVRAYDVHLIRHHEKLTQITPPQPLLAQSRQNSSQIDSDNINKNEASINDGGKVQGRRSPSEDRASSPESSPYTPLSSPPLMHPPKVLARFKRHAAMKTPRPRITLFSDSSEANVPRSQPTLASRLSPPDLNRDAAAEILYAHSVDPEANPLYDPYPESPRSRKLRARKRTTPFSSAELIRPNKKSNSYRAWPSYRQAVADRERNAVAKLNALRVEYEEKRHEELARTRILVLSLNRAITKNHEEQGFFRSTANMHHQQGELDDRALRLDERARRFDHKETLADRNSQAVINWRDSAMLDAPDHATGQADRLGRVYIQLADILKTECGLSTPFFAFQLHRRITPTLVQLAAFLAEPHDSICSIVASPAAVNYYGSYVRELQYLLYDDEWAQLSDFHVDFEDKLLPSNPKIRPYRFDFDPAILASSSEDDCEVSEDDDNGW